MTVHDRIKLVVKWLIGTGVANNQEAIGRLMGYSNKSSFSQILNNKVPIPGDFTDRLCALNDNINKVWVEKEVGNMLRSDARPTMPATSVTDVVSENTTLSETVLLRLIDKLDEKDALLKEKDAKIDHLQSELRSMGEELVSIKTKLSQYESQEHTDISELPKIAKGVDTKPHSSTSAPSAGSASYQQKKQ